MASIMLKKPALRRAVAVLLLALGALLLFLAPETWVGILLLVLGVSVELIGMALKHRSEERRVGKECRL